MDRFRLVNRRTGCCLLPNVWLAAGPLEQMAGLLGRRGLAPDTGMYFPGAWWIHMFFMRFPIDVVYLRDGTVKKLRHGLKPWRMSWCPGAKDCLEAPAGWADAVGLAVGDEVALEKAPGEPS